MNDKNLNIATGKW